MKFSKIIALAIAVISMLWIASGFLRADSQPQDEAAAQQAAQSQPKKITDVRVRESVAEAYSDDVTVTGRTQASRNVEMKAETSGLVEKLTLEEGDPVKTGDVLAELEPRDRDARVREAQERVNQRQIEYNAAKKLEDKGFNSKVKLAQTLADLENAKSALKLAQVDQGKTKILAPFDGVLAEQSIEIGDYLAVGEPLFQVVELNPIEFVGYVSERRIRDISTGKDAQAEFLDGSILKGKVSYIAPAADAETRTFRVLISAANENQQIREGLTAKIRIPVENKKAHKISPSILALNDAGQVGVKVVGEGSKVKFVPVTILADEPKAMWISGLPEKARIITVGQEFVIDGQVVNPVQVKEDGLL